MGRTLFDCRTALVRAAGLVILLPLLSGCSTKSSQRAAGKRDGDPCTQPAWATTLSEVTSPSTAKTGTWNSETTTDDGICTIKSGMRISFDKPADDAKTAGGSFDMYVKFNGTPDSKAHHLHENIQVFDSDGNSLFIIGPWDSVDLTDNDFHEWKETFTYPATENHYKDMAQACRRPASGG